MPGRRYQILEKIGEGGMAEVFKALALSADGSSDTIVLKRILPHLAGDAEYVTMFVDEARIASALEHPNIVRVLDLGRMDGQIFLALEYVDGADLRELLRRVDESGAQLSIAAILFAVHEVLLALHHAHEYRDHDGVAAPVIHRDVSPQNVLVSKKGAVKLLDFGIAKKRGMDSHTAVGMVKGNALYLSPEQATGRPVDARTDVYQAGLLLMTLSLGRMPFESESIASLVDRARRADIPAPTTFRPDLPPFVDDLVARATALDPAERFQSADEFRAGIESIANRERIPLDPRNLVRDLEWAFGGGADKATSTVAVASGAKPAAAPLHPREQVVLEEMGAAEPSEAAAAPGIPEFIALLAPHAIVRAEEEISHTFASFVVPATPPAELESTRISAQQLPPESTTVQSPGPAGGAAASSADSDGDENEESTRPSPAYRDDGEEDERTRVSIAALSHEAQSSSATLETPAISAPSARRGVSAPPAPAKVPRAPAKGAQGPAVLHAHRGGVFGFAVAPAAGRAVSGGADGMVRVWNLASGRVAVETRAHEGGVHALALSARGDAAVTTGADGVVRAWALGGPSPATRVLENRGGLRALAMSADGTIATGGGDDAVLVIWDLARGRSSASFAGHEGPITATSVFADRMRVVSAGEDATIRVWSLEASMELATLATDAPVRSLALSLDGGILLAGCDDGTVSAWSVDAGVRVQQITPHGAPVTAVCLSPDGKIALSGAADGTVIRWDVARGAALASFTAHEGAVTAVALAPDGVHALSAGEDGDLKGW